MRNFWCVVASVVLLLGAIRAPNAVASPATPPVGSGSTHRTSDQGRQLCGWYENPTPQDFSLDTASARWIIGEQGGFQAEGDWPDPKFRRGQWVHTNGRSYGYGCACLRGVLDASTRQVVRVFRIEARSLRMCRSDPKLRAREPKAS